MRGNRIQRSGQILGILLPMGLICLFAFCSLALALMGGQAYKNIQQRMAEGYGTTVAGSYLRNKIVQHNEAGAVTLRTEGDIEVLVLTQQRGDTTFETRIFYFDGWLMESFLPADRPFALVDASAVAELGSCTFRLSDDGMFEAELTGASGEHSRVVISLAKGGTA